MRVLFAGQKKKRMSEKREQLIIVTLSDFVNIFSQPSMEVFKNMIHELESGRENPDGADQGFIGSYFPDLLDQPMFHPPLNGTKLLGTFRLPLSYQMDASYYCKLSINSTHLFSP